VGSITNWDSRDFVLPLNFLEQGKYQAKIFADGANADKVATSVTVSERLVTGNDTLKVHLAPGGGWAAILERSRP
jgi:alpha-glucosidase